MPDDHPSLSDQAKTLLAECRQLRDEIQRLRLLLEANDIDPDPPKPAPASSPPPSRSILTTEQKIAVFRSLFRGREDVFALRWEAPDGRHGYSPKAERDWTAYYASRPEDRKRVDKETRRYIPPSDQAIHDHLAGKQTVGVQPPSQTWRTFLANHIKSLVPVDFFTAPTIGFQITGQERICRLARTHRILGPWSQRRWDASLPFRKWAAFARALWLQADCLRHHLIAFSDSRARIASR